MEAWNRAFHDRGMHPACGCWLGPATMCGVPLKRKVLSVDQSNLAWKMVNAKYTRQKKQRPVYVDDMEEDSEWRRVQREEWNEIEDK